MNRPLGILCFVKKTVTKQSSKIAVYDIVPVERSSCKHCLQQLRLRMIPLEREYRRHLLPFEEPNNKAG